MSTAHSPFKFLDSYSKEDNDIFFGREREVDDLYSRIFQSKLLLIYGASGTGKSSLVNCGLANKFQDTDWLPVNVRRGLNINQSMLEALEKLALTLIRKKEKASFAQKVNTSLKSVYLDYFKPMYFIFDQFEELFISGSREEWEEFIKAIKVLMDSDFPVKFIFIIRGEYLEYLSEFEDIIPDFFGNRIRIEKMTRKNAIQCIDGPCRFARISVEENFAENLLTKLSPDKAEIELTYLQVFLDRVYKIAHTKMNGADIRFDNSLLEALGNVGDVLSQFLEEQISQVKDSDNTLTVLKAFVTTEGTKRQVSVDDVLDFVGSLGHPMAVEKAEEIILELVSRRILKDKDDANRYELRHDSLAAKIYQKITQYERDLIEVKQFLEYAFVEHKKRKFLLNESDLAYIVPYEGKLNLRHELNSFVTDSKKVVQRKKRGRKQFYAVASVIIILLITSVVSLYFSLQQKAKAEDLAIVATNESLEAQRQKELAEQQRLVAIQNEKRAVEQSNLAQEQSLVADYERQRALQARQLAEQQRLLALEEKARAEQAKTEADKNALEATKQKILADFEKQKADRFRMLALARSVAAKSTQLEDKTTRALLSLQALRFNETYDGYAYQADIYIGLYDARGALLGGDFNETNLHKGTVKSMAFHDPFIYTGGSDGLITKSQTTGYKLTKTVLAETNKLINTIALNKDGKLLAVGTGEGIILIFETATGTKVKELEGHTGGVWSMVFAGQKLLSAGKDNRVYLWNIENNARQQIGFFKSIINKVDINKGEDMAIVGLANGTVVLLPLAENAQAEIINEKPDNPVTSFAIGPSQMLLAIGYENGLIELKPLKKHDAFWNYRPTPALQTNVLGTLLFSDDATVSLSSQKAAITNMLFSSDGKFLYVTSMDGRALIWDVETQNELPVLLNNHGAWVMAAALTHDLHFITGDNQGVVRVFPTDPKVLSTDFCTLLNRNLTDEQWRLYLGDDIPYEATCNEITQNK
jgi:WD40 repeat protein/energy-coupling factor transporter ATP-binding protein EcfA2